MRQFAMHFSASVLEYVEDEYHTGEFYDYYINNENRKGTVAGDAYVLIVDPVNVGDTQEQKLEDQVESFLTWLKAEGII